jgi:hypothetical protein
MAAYFGTEVADGNAHNEFDMPVLLAATSAGS